MQELEPAVVEHTCNSGIQEADAGGLQFWGQRRLQKQNKTKQKWKDWGRVGVTVVEHMLAYSRPQHLKNK